MLPVSGVFGERVLIYMLAIPVQKLCNGLSRFYIQFYHSLYVFVFSLFWMWLSSVLEGDILIMLCSNASIFFVPVW